MTAQEGPAYARLHAGRVLAESLRALGGNVSGVLRLGWPVVGLSLLASLVPAWRPETWAALAAALVLVPVWVMVSVSWHRLLAGEAGTVKGPGFGWSRAHFAYLGWLLLILVVLAALTVAFVLPMGALDLTMETMVVASSVGIWLIVTLLTPLLLKLPETACGGRLPKRAWDGRLANVLDAALVWLAVLVAVAVLSSASDALAPAQPAVAPPELAGLVAARVLDYLLWLVVLTVLTVMYRRLGGGGRP